jgi:Bacterial Ig-like domain
MGAWILGSPGCSINGGGMRRGKGTQMEFFLCVGIRHPAGRAKQLLGVMVLVGVAFGVGCTASRDPVLGWNGQVTSADTTRPQVTVTVPATVAPAMTGVSTGTVIAATFTENLASATINPASFTVTGPGGTVVAGTVTYTGRTATFTPTFALAGGTTFTATIVDTATDTSGNALSGNQGPPPGPSNYVWTFTTGPGLVQSQLNLGAVQAFGQIQASADGSIRNDVVAGEPVPAQTAVDVSGTIQVRHGFYLPPAR